jgi:hypothetical protein
VGSKQVSLRRLLMIDGCCIASSFVLLFGCGIGRSVGRESSLLAAAAAAVFFFFFSFFFLIAWDLFSKLVSLCEFVVGAAPGAASSPSPPPPSSSSLFFYVASSSLAFAQLGVW